MNRHLLPHWNPSIAASVKFIFACFLVCNYVVAFALLLISQCLSFAFYCFNSETADLNVLMLLHRMTIICCLQQRPIMNQQWLLLLLLSLLLLQLLLLLLLLLLLISVARSSVGKTSRSILSSVSVITDLWVKLNKFQFK